MNQLIKKETCMNIIQNYYILDQLDLPTVPWQECQTTTTFDENLLWTVKSEPIHHGIGRVAGKIGITARDAKEYVNHQVTKLDKDRRLIYYPYYTAYKSGRIDLTYDRSVIEAVEGKIENLLNKNRVNVTMIFGEDKLEIFGDESFLTKEESICLIDHCKEIRKRCIRDIEFGKNILLNWSFVQETKRNMIPKDEKLLVFYEIQLI